MRAYVHRGYPPATTCQRDGEVRSSLVDTHPVASSASTPSLAERSLRHAVEAQREAILVCTSRHAVAVRVAWSVDGMTAVSLDGVVHATPTEGCVRDVLAGLRAPPGEHGGALLQAITTE